MERQVEGTTRTLDEALALELRIRPSARVAVIAERPRAAHASLLPGLATEDVAMVRSDRSLDRMHAQLTARGPYDLILDAGGPGATERFRRFLFHAAPGRAYVIKEPQDDLRSLLSALSQEAEADGTPATARQRDRRVLRRSIGQTEWGRNYLLARNTANPLSTVPDRLINRAIGGGRLTGEVLDRVPGAQLKSQGSISVRCGTLLRQQPDTYDAPALHLREWSDVVCRPRQIAVQSGVLLPASIAVRSRGRLGHHLLEPWAPGFVGRPPDEESRDLPGRWYYLDNQVRGHFGHAISEQLSMTWGWQRAQEIDPSTRVLVGSRAGAPVADWELQLLEAAGISREMVHVAETPVRVESLVTATPLMCRPDYVHPELAPRYDEIGASLSARGSAGPTPRRIFFSRRPGNRSCHNAAAVETRHREAGFEILHPEDLPLPEQVRLVRQAEVIAGFAGSGIFHIALAGSPKHVIVIGSESYHVQNEQMFAAALGHRLELFLCRPDVPRGKRFESRSFHSAFTFDFEQDGRSLDRVLDGLG